MTIGQAEQLAEEGISVAAPPGDTVSIADTAEDIEDYLDPDTIAALPTIGVSEIASIDTSVTLDAAQASALVQASLTIAAPGGDTVSVSDTLADIESLTPDQIKALGAIGITTLSSTGALLSLSVAQALALESASMNATAPYPNSAPNGEVILQDTAAKIQTLTPNQIALLPGAGITNIFASDVAIDFTVAQAEAAQTASLVADIHTIQDTAENIETLLGSLVTEEQTGQKNLFNALGVRSVTATDASIVLTPAEAQAITHFEGFEINVPAGDSVTVADTAANIESFLASASPYTIESLSGYNIQEISATDGPVALTVSEALELEVGALPISVPTGDTVSIDDTAADIETTTPEQIAGLTAVGVSKVIATDAIIGSGTLVISNELTLEASGAVSAQQTVRFDTSINAGTAVLLLDDPADFAGTIATFVAGDSIALNPVDATLDDATLDPSGHIITLIGAVGSDPGPIGTIDVAPAISTSQFGVENNAVVFDEAACFLAGTLISAEHGQVPVERLAVGDKVRTLSGALHPIVWIGTGRVRAMPGRRTAATPVIVRKGALADNVPHSDLRVTKGHSLFVDDVLIPVEFLVNCRSIVWDDRAREVQFYHVELAQHDVLLFANGVLAESYRDDGNRWLFRNANSGWDQPPKPPCVPVLTGGPVVDAVWKRLLERAGGPVKMTMTDQPDLHLRVDGQRVNGHRGAHDRYVFRLPAPPSQLRVVSRAVVPSECGLVRDPRLLGVALRRILLWQEPRVRLIEASDPVLQRGFHLFEEANGFRWTDGDALLPREVFAGLIGAFELELHIGCATQYPLFDESVASIAA